MSRLADPSLCPDCRGAVGADATCSACGLVLRGPLADRLWQTMLLADGLVEQLRAVPAGVPVPLPVSRPQPAPRVPGRTVPALLLALGGLLVFVAVSLFLAVTWTVLPLGFKALIMAGFTVAVSAGAFELSRRDLRGSAEAIWGLAGAVLALDLSAAYRAGLFGLDAVSLRAMTISGGLVVTGFGLMAGLVVSRTRMRHSHAADVVLLLAALAVSAAGFWTGPLADGVGPAAGVVVLAAAAFGLWRLDRPLAASGTAVLGVLSWLDLVGQGWARGWDAQSRGGYWAHGAWWQLVVAAALAAVPTVVVRLPRPWRVGSAAAALATAALAGLQPGLGDTTQVLQAAAVLLVLAVVAAARTGVWSTAARWVAAAGVLLCAVAVALTTALTVLDFVAAHDEGVRPGTRFPVWDDVASWTLLVVVAVVAAAGWVVLPARAHRTLVELLPGAALISLAGTLAGGGAPVWAVAAALGSAATLLLAGGLRSGAGWPVTAAAPAGLAAVLATLSSATVLWVGFGATALAVAALVLAPVVTERERDERWAELAAGLVGLAALVASYDDAGRSALLLTVLGSAAALASVLRADHQHLGWVGSGLLVVATVERVLVAHTPAPELYAMPAAALLLGVGGWRLAREPQLGTWRILGSGLSLALLPSLVLSLGDPGSLRTALVVVGAAVALGVGLERRWQAPFLYGVGVLTVLALRFLLPLAADVLADPLGAWLLFGAAGGACLTVGVLWEHSLRNLRTAGRFVGSLR